MAEASPTHDMLSIPLEFINVTGQNPRKAFDQEALDELKESIRAHGILEPLIVRNITGGYELVAGERRFRAAQQLEFHAVPCVVRDLDDHEVKEVRLLENLQRQDLSAIEEASAIREILADGCTQQELAKKLGKSQTWISQRIKLLDMPEDVIDLLISGAITPKHALALAPIAQYPKIMESAVNSLVEAVNDGDTVTVDGMSEIISGAVSENEWDQWNPEDKKGLEAASTAQINPLHFRLKHLTAHIDLSECEKCPRSMVLKEYGHDNTYCLDVQCYAKKLAKGKEKFDEFQKEQAKELGVKGEIDSQQLRIDGVTGLKHLCARDFDQSVCESCDKRKKDSAFNNSYLCMDPECYEKKQKDYKAVQLRESKDGWSKVIIALDKATLPKQGGTLNAPTAWLKRLILENLCREWEYKEAVNRSCKSFGCNHGNAHQVLSDDDLDCVLTRIMLMSLVDHKVRMGAKPSTALVDDAIAVAKDGIGHKTKEQQIEDDEEEAMACEAPECYGMCNTEACDAKDEASPEDACEYWHDCHDEIGDDGEEADS